ncbi:SDR family NAD(P)-dependent oxidoreductase [Streptomyces sp. NPDC092296]|uniref:SDR family NAD(P)-dependent oxidoreductase n=1 Tax=Streptomyces sp. NPDC092296 TaxID=3366012 RepID=UPI0037F5F11C
MTPPTTTPLTGRTALVTGGTRGIGHAIAKRLAQAGADLVITGRSRTHGQAALADLGDRAVFVCADATRRPDAERAVEDALTHFGRLDILVNNVGGATGFGTVAELSDTDWHDTLAANLDPMFYTTRRALPELVRADGGRIINVSSIEGKHADPGLAAYAAAKHAVIGFTKSLAREVGPLGITANCLCPGMVVTDWIEQQGPHAAAAVGISYEQLIGAFTQRTALGRLTTCEEVADVALFLATPGAAGVTGVAWSVDGGSADH